MRTLPLILSIALLAGCGESTRSPQTGESAAACAGDGIVISNAWMRAAPAGRPMSAAYLTLCNAGDSPDRLLRISTEAASAAELHESRRDASGVASMTPVDGLALAPNEAVALAPGGAHIMLIGMTHAVEAGDAIALTLEFETAPPQTIIVEARALSAN